MNKKVFSLFICLIFLVISLSVEAQSSNINFYEIQNQKDNKSFSQIPPGYLDYPGIVNEMNNTQCTYPSICKVYDLTDLYDMGPTYDGNHIYAMKISDNVLVDEDEPNFLMVSCHHAREIVTPVIALYSINQLATNYGTNPDITAVVNEYEIWISPVWNPDGYQYVYNVYNMWRKNRKPYSPGVGVDLNRNYPFGWSIQGGSTDPNSETYRGPSPASEVETQTMMVFGNDRHFTKVLDYHSYGREVLFGYLSLSHPFQSFLQSEAVLLSQASGYGGSIRDPSANGENYEWHLAYNGSYANLIETHNEFQPSSYSSALAEAAMVWPGALWMLQRPITVSGHVRDSTDQAPLVAEIKLIGVNFQNGEHFFSEPRFGRYHLFLPAGTYSIEFSCGGYYNQTQEVTVTQNCAEILEVQLQRLNEPPNKPTIDGPTNGDCSIEYEFTLNATDPNCDDLQYYVKWGDGNISGWVGPIPSGEKINLSHTWKKEGTYFIFAKVKDIHGEESESASLQITIPRNRIKTINGILLRLINRFQNIFSLLQNLLNT